MNSEIISLYNALKSSIVYNSRRPVHIKIVTPLLQLRPSEDGIEITYKLEKDLKGKLILYEEFFKWGKSSHYWGLLIDPQKKRVYQHIYCDCRDHIFKHAKIRDQLKDFEVIDVDNLKIDVSFNAPITNINDKECKFAIFLLREYGAEIKVASTSMSTPNIEFDDGSLAIRGDTYNFRDIIKEHGGRWNSTLREWEFQSIDDYVNAKNEIEKIIERRIEEQRQLQQALEELKGELEALNPLKKKKEEKKVSREISEELKEKLLPEWLCKVYIVVKSLQSEYKGAKGEYEVNGNELKETKIVFKDKAIAFRNFRSRFTRFLRLTSIRTPMGWIIANPTDQILNLLNQYMNEYADLLRMYSSETPIKPIRLIEVYIPKKVVIEMTREYVEELKASLEGVEKKLEELEEMVQKAKDEDTITKLTKESKRLERRKKELKKLIDQAMNFIEEIEKPKKIPELISKRVEALKKVL